VLYSKNFYQGTNVFLKKNTSCLVNLKFNDIAASLKIVRAPHKDPKPRIQTRFVTHTLKGSFRDATTGEVIKQTRTFSIVAKNKAGRTFRGTMSPDGSWTMSGLLVGDYEFTLMAKGWITVKVTKNVTALNAKHVGYWDWTMSREIDSDQWRFVLAWSSVPKDLDSTLIMPGKEKIFWNNKNSKNGLAQLDVDNQNGFGPETITVTNKLKGNQKYSYYVHNYSRKPSIKVSLATVTVYNGSRIAKHFDVPTTGINGLYWYVCDLTKNGIVSKNVIVKRIKWI
jgi:stress response protein SCP2